VFVISLGVLCVRRNSVKMDWNSWLYSNALLKYRL